jgi:peroxiredoxin (alkyl hydroperoxide reductase subunit C)
MGTHFLIPVRRQAPEFVAQAVLPDNSISTVELVKMRGKYVVLLFYPMDFSAVCPSEIIAMEKKREEFEERNAVLWAISTDSVNSHLAWKQQEIRSGGIGRVGFPLLSDPTREISRSYGVLVDEAVALRGLFIIDREGIIRHVSVNDLTLGRNMHEVLRSLDSLIFYEKHGEVCPANWKKGDRGIVPTPEGIADYLSRFS